MSIASRRSNAVKAGFPFKSKSDERYRILVTGFYDWVNAKGLPAGANKSTEVNPSGHLLKGAYNGKLEDLLKTTIKTSREGCSIAWSFQCLRVSEKEAVTLDHKDYDMIIGLGFGNDVDDATLILEDGASNLFRGSDVDELTRIHGLAKNAEKNTNAASKVVNQISNSLSKINKQEFAQVDAMGLVQKTFKQFESNVLGACRRIGQRYGSA